VLPHRQQAVLADLLADGGGVDAERTGSGRSHGILRDQSSMRMVEFGWAAGAGSTTGSAAGSAGAATAGTGASAAGSATAGASAAGSTAAGAAAADSVGSGATA